MGTTIAHELYRQGFETVVIAGPCEILPINYSHLYRISTNDQMLRACQQAIEEGSHHLVMAASVLDFIPSQCVSGKIPSDGSLSVEFQQTVKILDQLNPPGLKIGFKLESDLNAEKAENIAQNYIKKYNLSMIVVNRLRDVSASSHKARVFVRHKNSFKKLGEYSSKENIAETIARQLKNWDTRNLSI